MKIKQIDAKTLKQWLDKGEATLIDVREPAEHAAEKISDAALHPLSSICCSVLPSTSQKMVIHCQKGGRAPSACQKLLSENSDLDLYNLEGGIEAWKAAGLPIETSGKKILPLDRQVQLTIGISVLLFSLLAYFVNSAFAFGAAFFGAGLINAGLTGWCGLGMLMAKMPWNR